MTVSASFNYSRTGTQIIAAALRKVGVLAEGASASTNQASTALEALNLMLKAWASKGIISHVVRTAYLYPDDGKNHFELSTGASHDKWSLELGLTKLTAAAAASATALTVSITAADDVVGTSANSDNIGIELDDGTIAWTTISAGGGTTSLTIATGIASAAASGNRVYFFTSRAAKPELILDAYRITASSGDRVEMQVIPESVMHSQSQVQEGDPIQYTARADEDDHYMFHIWPRWQDGKTYIEIIVQYPIDDMDAGTDTFMMPVHTYEALVYGLAVRLAPEYGMPLQERLVLKQEAETMINEAFAHLREGGSLFVQPDVMNG